MKKIHNSIIVHNFAALLVLIVFCAVKSHAAGEPGKFLSWGAGGRSMAMANAYVGIVDDVYSIYYNPGALGVVDKREVGTFHAILWEDSSYTFAGYVHPTLNKGCLGAGIVRLYSGGAKKRDENNLDVGSFDNSQIAVTVGYGTYVLKNISWGISGKFINFSLDSHSYSGMTVDSGFFVKVTTAMTAGANIGNIIAATFGDTEDQYPLNIKFGFGYQPILKKLTLSLDFNKSLRLSENQDGETKRKGIIDDYSFGVEGKVIDMLALRTGYNKNEFTTGFGIGYGNMAFDYAMSLHNLGLSHRISLNMKFGPSINRLRDEQEKRLAGVAPELPQEPVVDDATKLEMQKNFLKNFKGANDLYRKGLYERSKEMFVEARKYDANDPNVPLYIERLELVIPIKANVTANDKVSVLMRRGITSFIDGNNEASVKLIAYAASLKTTDFDISRLKARIEEKTGIRIDYEKPVSGRTIVDQMLQESLIAFHKKDYTKVIDLCEEVLVLEPNTAMAFKRLGSALYALGEKEEAVRAWNRALEIAPDADLQQMLKKIGK